MAGEIYLNDSLLWRDASLAEPYSRSWNMPRYWLLPEAALRTDVNTLWIRASGMRHDRLGLGSLALGDADTVQAVHQHNSWLQRHVFTLNLTTSLALALLFLALWAVRRAEAAFGWFALASLLWSLFAGTMLATTPWPLSTSADWNRCVASLFVGYSLAFCRFTWSFGEQELPRTARVLLLLALLACAVLWLVPDPAQPPALVFAIVTFALVFLGNCVQFQLHAWRRRDRHIVFLAACLGVFLAVGLRDLLVALGILPGSFLLAPFTAVAAMLFMFLIVADRFARSFRQIERYNSDLEAAVEATRAELTRTLKREHELQLSNIRLGERLRLSHDLHDSLGSSLVRSIATVEQANSELGNRRFLSMLKELRDDLRQIIDNTSGSGSGGAASPGEWIAALRQRFARLFDELGLSSHWSLCPVWPLSLRSTQRMELARCIEEALTNVLKHSRASCVEVLLQPDATNGLLLCIRDDGIGFDTRAALEAGGVGMHSMRARVARIGGTLTIRSEPGESCVEIRLEGEAPATADAGQ
jgi:two-component system sensor histidine kinase UhpB